MPGKLAVGGGAQTGTLEGPGVKQNGAKGLYTFGSQRIWLRHPGIDNSGVSGFYHRPYFLMNARWESAVSTLHMPRAFNRAAAKARL
jgi:hypothetical protein